MGTMIDKRNLKSTAALAAAAAAAAVFGALIIESRPAAAQQFDCRDAEIASERTICRNGKLGNLDERMSNLYSELMQASGSERQREGLRNYQRHFLAARDSCGRDTDCIKGAYLDQISVLEARLEQAYRRSER
jgi:uncharacterized protein